MRCGALAVALALAAGVASAEPVPVKDFARSPDYYTAKISPGGEYLAVDTMVEGQRALGVINLKTRKITGAVRFTQGQWVADYWWVGPSRVVMAMATSYGPLDQPVLTGELYGMNADGSNKLYLFGYRGGSSLESRTRRNEARNAFSYVLDPLPEDPQHAVVWVQAWSSDFEANPTIERLDVTTGESRKIDLIPLYCPCDVALDDKLRGRYAAGLDRDSKTVRMVRDKPEDEWRQLPRRDNEPQDVDLHRIAGDSVLLSADDGTDRTCLLEYHLDTGKQDTLSCNDTVDVAGLEYLSPTGRPTAIDYEKDYPGTVYLGKDSDDTKLLRDLKKSFGGQRVTVTSYTLDGSKLVLLVDSDRNPGDFYLFDRVKKSAEYLLSRRRWIDPEKMASMEPIWVKMRDGATIGGYLTLPPGQENAKGLPLVMIPHGGPHGVRDYWNWDEWGQLLASRGYAVLQVNYRGSGGYGITFLEAGYRHWGTLMQDDLTDSVKWAVAQGVADPARVCIFGGSYGGYAALMSATREPGMYRCAVGLAGVYDLPSQISSSDTANFRYGRNYLKKVLGTDAKELVDQSPLSHVDRLKAAVLIAHGTADRRVPFSQAKVLRKALTAANKPFEWMEFDGEEHGFYKDENKEKFYNKLLEFLDKNIGAAKPEAAAAQN